ncbi:leucine-rich repeat protein [Acetobacterium carbinolicum]|uniref:leucine-rich repeat protein n=1 Tax=Acetobacterium carbinolicum TaxID=52690 RepID=UPI0039C9C772
MNNKFVYQCALITILFLWLPLTAWAADNPVGVSYRGHIQDQGDYPADGSWVDSPELIGTVGQSKRIEGFEIKLTGTVPEGMELRYNVHVQNKGWLYDENDSADWPKDGVYAGTRGDGLRIEAVKIVLTDRAGKALTGYSVQYRGHVQNVGDLPADKTQWLVDGAQLGTVGSSLRLEALLVQVVKTTVDPPEPIEPTVYDKVGTYGPTTGTETVAGDVTITADGVTLQNLVIQGNLTISEAVGDGNVTLNNVTVKGDTFVHGGGVNSIKISGGAYSRIVMEKTASGAVRIVATDVAGMAVVIAEDATGETIILEGTFDSVEVNAPNMTVTTQGATTTIGTMTVSAGAAGSTVTVAAGTTVSDLVLDGKAAVKGQGNVVKVEVKADGVVFDKKPGAVTVEPGVVIPPVFPTPDSGGVTPPGPIAVTAVSLNKSALILSFDDTEILAATVAPADATNKTVTWTTSDATIATVDATGKVTGSANTEGEATITATSADGTQSANCTVAVTRFKVTKTADGIGTITGMNGSSTDIVIPETIGGLTITAISDQAFSGCSNLSSVTLPLGLTAIGAEAFNNCSKLTDIEIPKGVISIGNAAFGFDAGKAPASRSYTFRGDVPGAIGASAIPKTPQPKIRYYEMYAGFEIGDWYGYTNKEVILAKPTNLSATAECASTPKVNLTWDPVIGASFYFVGVIDTNNPNTLNLIADTDVNSVTLTTDLISGETFEYAIMARDDYGTSLWSEVIPVAIPYPVPVTGLTISAAPIALIVGEKGQLSATVTPANATNKGVLWYSLDPTVATVDAATGVITAVAPGTAIMQGKTEDGSFTNTCSVTVTPVQVEKVTLNQDSLSVAVAKTAQLIATVTPTNAADKTLTWSSNDESIATVDANGMVTGNKKGTAIITVTSVDGAKVASCTVNVIQPVTGIKLQPSLKTLGIGMKFQLPVTVEPADASNMALNFTSNNPSVATVDENGLITALSVGNFIITVRSADGSCSESCIMNVIPFAYSEADGKITITKYSGNESKLSLPDAIDFKPVVAIGESVFENNTTLTEVMIKTNMVTIGNNAFKGCTNLSTVILEGGMKLVSIGDYAFNACAIKTITIPGTLKTIGNYAFENCNDLSQIVYDGGTQLETIGIASFSHCALNAVVIPASVTTIGDDAFNGSYSPTIIFDSGTKPLTIGDRAFFHCAIKAITIPARATYLGMEIFENCKDLSQVIIEDGSESLIIGDKAFANLMLSTITIPARVTAIGNSAFYESTTLSDVIFKSGTSPLTIGNWAFYKCPLSAVTIPGRMTAIGDYAFAECPLSTVTFDPGSESLSLGNRAFNACSLSSLIIPARMTTIGDYAFYGNRCSNVSFESASKLKTIGNFAFYYQAVTSITIPASVTIIGNSAFSNCNELKSIIFESGSQLATIGVNAFNYCAMTNITIPASVTAIGDRAFSSSNLNNISFESGSQLKIIGNLAFSYSKLKAIAIPASVTAIGEEAFKETPLISVTFDSGSQLETIGSHAFEKRDLISVSIPASVTAIGDGAFKYCNKLETVSFESNSKLKEISPETFYECALTSVTIPASVTAIGDRAFADNNKNSLSIEFDGISQLETIGEIAFYSSGLTSIKIPASVKTIGSKAFGKCYSLSSVDFDSGSQLLTIGPSAFLDCALKSIAIPNSVTEIKESAFTGNALTTIRIGANVSLGDAASLGKYGSVFNTYYQSVKSSAAGTYTYNTTANMWLDGP